jgi:hypothetical protein
MLFSLLAQAVLLFHLVGRVRVKNIAASKSEGQMLFSLSFGGHREEEA